MTWTHDTLTPVDNLLFQSELVKMGHFRCAAEDLHFRVTESLDNDVFVFVRNPLWYRRGRACYRFVEPGAVLLHRAGASIERKPVCRYGDNAYWFGIRPDVFIELLQRHGLSETEMGDALIAEPQLRYQLSALIAEVESGIAEDLQVEERVLRLLTHVCRARAGDDCGGIILERRSAERHHRLVDRARAFLDSRLSETVSLETISKAAGTSHFHLCRVFKAQVGMTLHAYRTRLRLGRIVDRMASGDAADLTELAHATGFSSHSHLCRVFQRHLGLSPSQFRRGGVSSRPSL